MRFELISEVGSCFSSNAFVDICLSDWDDIAPLPRGPRGAGLVFAEEKRLKGRTDNGRRGSNALAETERAGDGRT